MNEKEYEYTFWQWCNEVKGTHVLINEYGERIWKCNDEQERHQKDVKEKYHDFWISLRAEYRYRKKAEQITHALESIRQEGINCMLCSQQNGHIKALSKHGIWMSYYATTGTIAGYGYTSVKGLDEFIRLCKA